MQGRKGQMAGLRHPQCGLGCFIIPHLTDKNNVRVFPQD